MTSPAVVYVVVPEGVDDPARPSGGNTYDRRICGGLAAIGWAVHERAVRGGSALATVLAGIPDGEVVLVDGMVASTAPDVLVPEAGRLLLVVLLHMPLHDEREARVLAAAVGVVTTSTWTRDSVLARYSLAADRVLVAAPGADLADLAPGTATGGELLCVAAVTPGKGQDVLVAALSSIADLAWRCTLVGSLDRDPAFVDACRTSVAHGGIEGRVRFAGPLTGADLDAAYAAADLLVLASRTETYGMVVTEALARGLPAIATKVGGLPEALGHDGDGLRPGLLVAPDDPEALATALRSWLGDSDARRLLRRSALERRTTLAGWSGTSRRISRVLEDVAG